MRFNSKILISITLGIVVVLIGSLYLFNSKQNNQTGSKSSLPGNTATSENVDFSASFAIYTNGIFRIFTAPMYHTLSADVFIEVSSPNIVNVKKSDITWGDFFATLPMKLDENCLITGTKQTFCSDEKNTLQFYLNGERSQSALDQIINPGDKLLVTYDRESSTAIQRQLLSIPNPE